MTGERYAVAWTPSARRDLARVPEKVAPAAVEFIYGSLSANPLRVGRELHPELAGHHSARRGDYRIIYRVDESARIVHVVALDHRADVYRRRDR